MSANQQFTNIKTISQLPTLDKDGTNGIGKQDLIEVSHATQLIVDGVAGFKVYNSRAITVETLNEYVVDQFIEIMHRDYEFPKQTIDGKTTDADNISKSDIYNFKSSRLVYSTFLEDKEKNLSCDCNGLVRFNTNPRINESLVLENFSSKYEEYVMNLKNTQLLLNNASPFFIDGQSNFSSEYKNVENNLREEETQAPGTEDEKHNRYVFRMTNYRSNEWTATHSGIFSCWGWVDMHTDSHPGNNCEAWIALEGKLNDKWCVLQVQPFNKYNGELISYVGFTFPVSKGLKLRLTSGFRVGTNSGKYQQENGSLANHIANCFVGGVYYANVFRQTKGGTIPNPDGGGGVPIEIDTIDEIPVIDNNTTKITRTNEVTTQDPIVLKSYLSTYVGNVSKDNIVVIDGNSTKTVKTDGVTESDPIALKSYVDKAISANSGQGTTNNYYIQDKDFLGADNSHLYKENLKSNNVDVVGSPWSYKEDDKSFIYTVQHDSTVLVTQQYVWNSEVVSGIQVYGQIGPIGDDTWYPITQGVELCSGDNPNSTVPLNVKAGTKFKFQFYTYGDATSSNIEIKSLKRNGRVVADKDIVLNNSEQSIGDFDLVKEFYWDHENYPSPDAPDTPDTPIIPSHNLINDDNSNVYNVPLKSGTLNKNDSPWTVDETEDGVFYYTVKHDGLVLANIVPEWSDGVDGIDVYMNLRKSTDTTDNWVLVNRAVEENSGTNSLFRADLPVKAGTKFRFEFYKFTDEPYKIIPQQMGIAAINDPGCHSYTASLRKNGTGAASQLGSASAFKTTDNVWSYYNNDYSFYYTVQHSGIAFIKIFPDWAGGTDNAHSTQFVDIYNTTTNKWETISQNTEMITDGSSGMPDTGTADSWFKIPISLNRGAKLRFRFGRWNEGSWTFSDRNNMPQASNHSFIKPTEVLNYRINYSAGDGQGAFADWVTEYYWDENAGSSEEIYSLRRNTRELATREQVLGTANESESEKEYNFIREIYWDSTRSARTLECNSPRESFNFHEEKIDESKKSTVAELKEKLNAVIEKLNAIAGTDISVDDL